LQSSVLAGDQRFYEAILGEPPRDKEKANQKDADLLFLQNSLKTISQSINRKLLSVLTKILSVSLKFSVVLRAATT